jgi:outer membrane protein, heavy metal efflux system
MRLSVFVLCFTVLLPFLNGQDLTEREMLQRLSAESPRAKALTAGVDLARATALTEGLRPNGSLTISRESAGNTPETYLLYEQPLSITGRRDYLRRAAVAAAESEAMDVRMQLHQLRVDARLAFLDLLLSQELLNIYDSEKTRLQEMVEVLKKRERAGESSGYDLIRAQRELSLLEADRGNAEARQTRARGQLSSFFADSANSSLRATGNLQLPKVPDVGSLISRSESRGDIQAENQLAESATFSYEAAHRKLYPEPIVSGGMKSPVITGNRESGYVLSVTVPLPLFDRGKAEMSRAEMARTAAQARATALKTEVRQRLRSVAGETETRIRAAEQYQQRAVAETGDLVKIARAAYEGGEVGILELIDAFRTQREVRLRLEELIAAAKQSALEIERLVGEEVIP